MHEEHFRTLGLEPGASPAEIRRAYRALARAYHPDLHPGDGVAEARFREVTLAYELISESATPREATGDPAALVVDGAPVPRGEFADRTVRRELRDRFEEMLGELFNARGAPRPRRGKHLRMDLGLSLEQMARGTGYELHVPSFRFCERCNGVGCEPSGAWIACAACRGRGRRGRPGALAGACPVCFGRGETPQTPCSACAGSGYREGARELRIAVPAGVAPGVRLRVRGAGLPGTAGAEAGDLLFDVRALPHDRFALDGVDGNLYASLGLDYFALLEGATVALDTPGRPVEVRVPARTQPGDWVRIEGAGMPTAEGSGDLWVKIELLFPTDAADATRLAAAAKVVPRFEPRVQAAQERPVERPVERPEDRRERRS